MSLSVVPRPYHPNVRPLFCSELHTILSNILTIRSPADPMAENKKRPLDDDDEESRDAKRPRTAVLPDTAELLRELVLQLPQFVKKLAHDRSRSFQWLREHEHWGEHATVLAPTVCKLAKNLTPLKRALEEAWEVALSELKRSIPDLPDAVRSFVHRLKNDVVIARCNRKYRYEWQVWLALQAGLDQFSTDIALHSAMERAIKEILERLQDSKCLRCGNRRNRLVLCDWQHEGLVCKKAMCKKCSRVPSGSKRWYCPRHPAAPGSCTSTSTTASSSGSPIASTSSTSTSAASDDTAQCWGERVCKSDEIGALIRDAWGHNVPPTKPGEPDAFSFFVAINALTNDWDELPLQESRASMRRGERNLKLMMRPYKPIWRQVVNIARGAASNKSRSLSMNRLRDRYQRVFLSPIGGSNLEDRLLSRPDVIKSLKRAHDCLINELSALKGLEDIERLIDQALDSHRTQQAASLEEPDQHVPKRAESVYQTIQARIPILLDLLARLQQTGRDDLVRDVQELLADLRQPFETAENGTFHSFAFLGQTGCGKSFFIDMMLLLSRSNEETYRQGCKEIKAELERLVMVTNDGDESTVPTQATADVDESTAPTQARADINEPDDPLADIPPTRYLQPSEEELQMLSETFQEQEREAQARLWCTDTAHEKYSFLLPAGMPVKTTTAVPIIIRRAQMYMASAEYLSPTDAATSLLQRAKRSIEKGVASEQTQVLEDVGAILGHVDESDQFLEELAAEADRPGPQFERLVSALCRLLTLNEETERNKATSFVFFGSGLDAVADRVFVKLVLRCTQGFVDNPFSAEHSSTPSTPPREDATIEQLAQVTSFEGYRRAADLGARLLPALRKVIVRCPSRVAPANGQLVDLPGTDDPIEIRNQIRDRFLEHTSFVAVLYSDKLTKDVLQALTKTPVWRSVVSGGTNSGARLAVMCNLERAHGAVSDQDLRDHRESRAQCRKGRAAAAQQMLKREVKREQKERVGSIPLLGPTVRRFTGNVLNTTDVFDVELNGETEMYSVLGLLEFFFMSIIQKGTLGLLDKISRVQRAAFELGSQVVPATRTRTSMLAMKRAWVGRVEQHAVEPFSQVVEQALSSSEGLTRATVESATSELVKRFEEALNLLTRWQVVHSGAGSIAPEKREYLRQVVQTMVAQLSSEVKRVLTRSIGDLNRPLRVESCEQLAVSPLAKLVFTIGGWTMFSRIPNPQKHRRKFMREFGKGLVEQLAETCFKCITEEPEETVIGKELQQFASKIRELSDDLHLEQALGDDAASWADRGKKLSQAYRHERLRQALFESRSNEVQLSNEQRLLRKAHKATAVQHSSLERFRSSIKGIDRVYLDQEAASAFDAWSRLKNEQASLRPITCQLPSDIHVQPLDSDNENDQRPLFGRALLCSLFPKNIKDARHHASELLRDKLWFSIAVDAPQSFMDGWNVMNRESLAHQLAVEGNGEELFSLMWLASVLKVNVLVLVGQQESIGCWRLIGNAASPTTGHVLACVPSSDGSTISLQRVSIDQRRTRSSRAATLSEVDTMMVTSGPIAPGPQEAELAFDMDISEAAALNESIDEDLEFEELEEQCEEGEWDYAFSDLPSIDELSQQSMEEQKMLERSNDERLQQYRERAMQGGSFPDAILWQAIDHSTAKLARSDDIANAVWSIEELRELVSQFSFFVDIQYCCERDPTHRKPVCEVRTNERTNELAHQRERERESART